MWTKDATCSMWIQRPKSHRQKWQEDRLRLQRRKTFLLEQLHRNQLPSEAVSSPTQEHSSRGAFVPPPRHDAKGSRALNADRIGGPWKSLLALRFCPLIAPEPLQ